MLATNPRRESEAGLRLEKTTWVSKLSIVFAKIVKSWLQMEPMLRRSGRMVTIDA